MTDNLTNYFKIVENEIKKILNRKTKDDLTYDILDTPEIIKIKPTILTIKQYQMKIGDIWQVAIGNYYNFTNLKTGHSSGLDVMSKTKKIIIEIKNRTNTDNASSKKSNFDKLARFKIQNPEYTCIYANINDSDEQKTKTGSVKKIIHNGVEIEHWIGMEFLKLIFEDNTDNVLDFIRNTVKKYCKIKI